MTACVLLLSAFTLVRYDGVVRERADCIEINYVRDDDGRPQYVQLMFRVFGSPHCWNLVGQPPVGRVDVCYGAMHWLEGFSVVRGEGAVARMHGGVQAVLTDLPLLRVIEASDVYITSGADGEIEECGARPPFHRRNVGRHYIWHPAVRIND